MTRKVIGRVGGEMNNTNRSYRRERPESRTRVRSKRTINAPRGEGPGPYYYRDE